MLTKYVWDEWSKWSLVKIHDEDLRDFPYYVTGSKRRMLSSTRKRWENNKMGFGEAGFEDMDWIEAALDLNMGFTYD
jgi:hypothetical protein